MVILVRYELFLVWVVSKLGEVRLVFADDEIACRKIAFLCPCNQRDHRVEFGCVGYWFSFGVLVGLRRGVGDDVCSHGIYLVEVTW